MMALAGVEKRSLFATAGDVIWKVVTHPFNIATVLGVIASVFKITVPGPVDKMLLWLSNALLHLVRCSCSSRSRFVRLGKMPPELPALVAIKLILHPLLIWVLLSAIATSIRSGLCRDDHGGAAAGAEHLRHLDAVQDRAGAGFGLHSGRHDRFDG